MKDSPIPSASPGRVVAVEPTQIKGTTADMPQEYDENLKPARPAFADEKEVWRACQNFHDQNFKRNARDAFLTELFFYKPPYDIKKLTDSGYSWSANVPSGFLAAAVGSVEPAFKRSVNGVKTLTNAKIKKGTKESDKLQSRVTEFIRSWSGWQNLIDCVIQERSLLGRAACRATDQYNWRPKFYTTQNSLFPEQSSQAIDDVPQVVFRDEWMPNELIEVVKNIKVAKANGWNIPNVVKVLNAAAPKDSSVHGDLRTMANWLADGAYSASYTDKGPVYVETWTMFAVEPDNEGQVSEWVVGKKEGELLYKKLNKYKRMSDAVASFAFTQGQNTLHSSRGIGRLLGGACQTYDRNFCKLLDDYYLSGMRVVHPTEKRKMDWSITVKSPFIICPVGIESEPMNGNMNVEIYYALVRQLTGLARQIAGVYTPTTILPDDKVEKTATQATIDAAKEGELREGVLSRWSAEISAMVWMMTRRLLDPKTYDEEAKAFQKKLLDDGFTRDDLKEFAECPPTDHISNYSTAIRNDKILKFAMANKGNPAYDQGKINYMIAESMVDPEFAQEIVLVQPDPTMDAQAIHDQKAELSLIIQLSAKIPPGPLDNDMVHLQVCMADTKDFIQGTNIPTPQQLSGLQNLMEHMAQHMEQASAKGAKPGMLKQPKEFLVELRKQIELYANNMAQGGQPGAGGVPQQQPQPAIGLPQGEPPAPAGPAAVGGPPIGPA